MEQKTIPVDCGDALTIHNALQLHQRLSSALNQSTHISLVAGTIAKVDTAGLQLITSLGNEIEKARGTLEWQAPSEILKNAVSTIGLETHFAFRNIE